MKLLDLEIGYDDAVTFGALELYEERYVRRWFARRERLTIGEILDLPAPLSHVFWLVMRRRFVSEVALWRLALDIALDYVRIVEENGNIVDPRIHFALANDGEWLEGRTSEGERLEARRVAVHALEELQRWGDQSNRTAALIAVEAMDPDAERALSLTFYTFLEAVETAAPDDETTKNAMLQFLRERARLHLEALPAPTTVSAPPSPAAAAGPAKGAELPVGTIVAYAGTTPGDLAQDGWLLCDGRPASIDEYIELYACIGFRFGQPAAREMNLPDLRGLFVRCGCADDDVRNQRDPDWRERSPLRPGGSRGAAIGSFQPYGTAPSKAPMTAYLEHLALENGSCDAGCGTRSTKYDSGSASGAIRSGGDSETRPDNLYVFFLVKARSYRNDGGRVRPPIGAIMGSAVPHVAAAADATWVLCDGASRSRVGPYRRLFDAIGESAGQAPSSDEFLLPSGRGQFLRGVSGDSGRDPDAEKRLAAAPGGNTGNSVGSIQHWATGMPRRPMYTDFPHIPTSNDGKIVNGSIWQLALLNNDSKTFKIPSDGGDKETRPRNVGVDWLICRSDDAQGDGDGIPAGTIAAVGWELPNDSWWLACDGRQIAIADFPELYAVLGDRYSILEGADTFGLPDYRGRFLRGAADSTAVGEVQDYLTARPRTDFSVDISGVPRDTVGAHGVTQSSRTRDNGSATINVCTSGGDGDTRPVNVYLHLVIRAR